MNGDKRKEATSFETCDSITKTFEVFDKIDLGDSDSEFSQSKHIQIEEASTGDIQLDLLDKIMDWFEKKNIRAGNPDSISESYENRQK